MYLGLLKKILLIGTVRKTAALWGGIAPLMLVAGLLFLQPGLSWGISVRHDRPIGSYNALGAAFPATGYFGSTTAGQFCTGTLVAPNKVLTAAHCVDFDADGTIDENVSQLAFGLGANIPGSLTANVASVAVNPEWANSFGDAEFDMAVLTLTNPINSVAPAQIFDGDPTGLRGFAVGYGTQGTGNNHPSNLPGANDKLGAENIIDFVGNTIEFDFDSPANNTSSYGGTSPLDLEGATAPGDSGSPLYAEFANGRFIVGILDGGFNPFGAGSEYGDISIYAPVTSNLNWLASQGIHSAAVPEPSSFGLGMAGLIGLTWIRRRRRPLAS